jgi:hypothetical protein
MENEWSELSLCLGMVICRFVARFVARATAGYCFSPLFGLLRTSPGFTALHPRNLKTRDSKGDSGNFPCKTRLPERLGFKSPLFTKFIYSL